MCYTICREVIYLKLTDSEIQIMELFWTGGKKLTGQDILAISPKEKLWKDNSIFIMLQTLIKKEAIREIGAIKGSTGKYQRVFEPTVSREDYYGSIFAETVSEESVPLVFASLLDKTTFSKETLSQLEGIIAAKIKGL